VVDGVNVNARIFRLARELAEAVCEVLLLLGGEVLLVLEDDDTTLGN
jgi:hypothetical protein